MSLELEHPHSTNDLIADKSTLVGVIDQVFKSKYGITLSQLCLDTIDVKISKPEEHWNSFAFSSDSSTEKCSDLTEFDEESNDDCQNEVPSFCTLSTCGVTENIEDDASTERETNGNCDVRIESYMSKSLPNSPDHERNSWNPWEQCSSPSDSCATDSDDLCKRTNKLLYCEVPSEFPMQQTGQQSRGHPPSKVLSRSLSAGQPVNLSEAYHITVKIIFDNECLQDDTFKLSIHEKKISIIPNSNFTLNLFMKVNPHKNSKFERIVRRNRTLHHEVKVYTELLVDLQRFVDSRVGVRNRMKINHPDLFYGEIWDVEQPVLIIHDLSRDGYSTLDWFNTKLTLPQTTCVIEELAKFHACGLAYKMSLKEDFDVKYPYLDDDLYTSNMCKELLAKKLDLYFHFLAQIPGIQEHVMKLRLMSGDFFHVLYRLRRPSSSQISGGESSRFNTICHGDMWMGNVMFQGESDCCSLIDFHSVQYLSAASDLVHLLLTSTDRQFRLQHWSTIIEKYYEKLNVTLAEFGLILRHLGTTYADFVSEVRRAVKGQFLIVAFIIPIVIYCGPSEWRIRGSLRNSSFKMGKGQRRGKVGKTPKVRHLIQMMAITEEDANVDGTEDGDDHISEHLENVPLEFRDLYSDQEMLNFLTDLFKTASDLDILDSISQMAKLKWK